MKSPSLYFLFFLLAASAGFAQPAPVLSAPFVSALDQVESSYRKQAEAWNYVDAAERGQAMRDFATPLAEQLSRPGVRVAEDETIMTGHGEQRVQRSTDDAAGALQFVEETTNLLGPPMGLELRGSGPTGRVVEGFRRDLAATPLDTQGNYRQVASNVNRRFYPHVLEEMRRFPNPAELERDAEGQLTAASQGTLAAAREFYNQAQNNYLSGLNLYGLELSPEEIQSLAASRQRFEQTEARATAAVQKALPPLPPLPVLPSPSPAAKELDQTEPPKQAAQAGRSWGVFGF